MQISRQWRNTHAVRATGSYTMHSISGLTIQPIHYSVRIFMALSSAQKKDLKRIAHHLKPVVLVSEQGANDGVVAELQRALNDHELIKIRINVNDREAKQALIAELCQQTGAELVQVIGKMAVLLKRNPEPNRNLSNLLRYKEL